MKRYSSILVIFLLLVLPRTTLADDTDIYRTASNAVEPNVMIIMDNSGSMTTKDVPGVYDPTVDYTPSSSSSSLIGSLFSSLTNLSIGWSSSTTYAKDAVYEKKLFSWILLVSNVDDIQCADVKAELKSNGYATANLTSTTDCGGSGSSNLRMGNFINYDNSGSDLQYRYAVAKDAIIRLLQNTTGKRFGLMHYNTDQGGYVKYPCGTSNATIISYLESMKSNDFKTYTPLAETLAETGLYFAGQTSWYTNNGIYTSPIQERCQKNYVIIMTDGEPTKDADSKLASWDYIISGKKIAGSVPSGCAGTSTSTCTTATSLLDDVAEFLYNNDISTLGDGTSLAKQNVITYTIGLKTDQQLLDDTAKKGGGAYYSANSASGLNEALDAIDNSINNINAVYMAPTVPVNRSTRTEQSEWLYLALFSPQSSGEWMGNIKKFAIGDGGEIFGKIPGSNGDIDRSLNVVDEFGAVTENACSFWTEECADGGDATKGGLGEKLQGIESADSTAPDIMAARKVYMLTGTNHDITDDENLFNTSNTALSSMDGDLINTARKLTGTWHLGAIIHSKPAVVHYEDKSVIYVGANDGMIHAFDDTNGSELWAFIPPGQVSRLSLLTDNNQDYYVDGSATITYGNLIAGTAFFQPKDLIIGERRGGSSYYVIDISNYEEPQYKFTIESGIVAGYPLGQSWCQPVAGIISGGTTTNAGTTVLDETSEQDVFLIAGGYDDNQDSDTPAATDSVGKAIISVKTQDGSLGSFIATPASLESMTHCIVDISTDTAYMDSHGRDIITRVYAGDLGGKVFAFSDDLGIRSVEGGKRVIETHVPDGNFATRLCLYDPQGNSSDAQGEKIFYPPQNSRMGYSINEWVVFGTGDRENPLETGVQNRIYAIKNKWLNATLTEDDLYDATANLIKEGDDTEKDGAASALETKDGWYINFYDEGEKLTSRPIIVQDYLYFTTYTPVSNNNSTSSDPCAGSGAVGSSYLWSVHLKDASPVNDTNHNDVYEKEERRQEVGIMAQPTLASEKMLSTPKMIEIPTSINFKYYFWRQQ